MCIPFAIAGLVVSLVLRLAGSLEPSGGVASPTNGCIAFNGGSCSYVAETVGGVVALGNSWSVEIKRDGRTIRLRSGDYLDVAGGALQDRNIIRTGDRVRANTGRMNFPFFGAVSVGTQAR